MDIIYTFLNAGYLGYSTFIIPVLLSLLFIRIKRQSLQLLETMNILIAVTALVYLTVNIILLAQDYSNEYERFAWINRYFGPYWYAAWMRIVLSIILPQFLWIKKIRTNIILSVFICIGLYHEKIIILLISLNRDFLPSSWGIDYEKKYTNLLIYLVILACLHVVRERYFSLSTSFLNRNS